MVSGSSSLTGRQRLVLKRIIESIAHRGYPPTVRELARALSVRSPNAVTRHLDALEKKGYIRRRGGARSITIPKDLAGGSRRTHQIELDERGFQVVASQLPGLTSRQREIMQKLHGLPAPELAKVYYAGVRLLSDRHNPARVYLVAHCVREIGNKLPDHLPEVPVRERVEYRDHLDLIAARWEKLPNPPVEIAGVGNEAAATQVSIPLDLFRRISALVTDHMEGSSSHRKRAEHAFARLDEGMASDKAHLSALWERWRNVIQWFVGSAHVRNPREMPPSLDIEECERQFGLFENLLYSSLHPFYAPVEELDEILEAANK